MLPLELNSLQMRVLKAGRAAAQCLRLSDPLLFVTKCRGLSQLLCPSEILGVLTVFLLLLLPS